MAAEFHYQDEAGAALFVVERVEYQNADGSFVVTKEGKRKKTFRQKRPDPNKPGRWLWNVDGVPALPYRLPEIIEAVAAGCAILIVEGEVKVEHLRSWNIAGNMLRRWREEMARRTFGIPARRQCGDFA